jgi:GalNAc-alpha-(1->4)-GalNAc-alpha-(1->3)-diNAcBac-PP-undecaprenol alpha-1,4-N-acetyl-D-galactosaminyltransferase
VTTADERRKILLLIPALGAGGAERVLVLMAKGFLERGHRVDVATIFGRGHDFYTLPPGAGRIALELARNSRGLTGKLAGNVRRIGGLRRAFRAAAPDVVISFLTETNVLAILATSGLGIPVIVSEQVDPRRHPLGRVWKILRRLTYRRAARLVSASAGVDAAFSWLPPACRTVIYNPICPEQLDAAPSAPAVFPWPRAVLAMGRLERQKGFDLLIDAFGRIAGRFPEWGLVILGEGSLRQELSTRIEALGLADRIRLPGVTASPAATLRRGDLFVFPSRYEGFGLTLAEAMAVGLPVIAADCPSGPAEIVRHEADGLLVPAEDAAALATAMSRLMADAAERHRLGDNARAAARRFHLSAAMPAWEALLAACCRRISSPTED